MTLLIVRSAYFRMYHKMAHSGRPLSASVQSYVKYHLERFEGYAVSKSCIMQLSTCNMRTVVRLWMIVRVFCPDQKVVASSYDNDTILTSIS